MPATPFGQWMVCLADWNLSWSTHVFVIQNRRALV
jgi:hypothetical protein